MAANNQQILLVIHIKNTQLISSRNPQTNFEIKQLLNSHFEDLSSLIQDLQIKRQLPN